MPGSVYRRTLRELRLSALWWMAGMAALTAFVIALFPAIASSLEMEAFMESLPPELLALFGVDPAVFQTAAGYLQAQFYSLAAPILMVVLGVRLGGRATAAEERSGSIDLLLANPLTRDRVVVEKLLASASLMTLVAAVVAGVLLVGNGPAGLGLPVIGILGMNLSLLLLGSTFGSAAALVGAWSGRPGTASGAAGGLAGAAFLVESLSRLAARLEGLAAFSPFSWYQAGSPLLSGFTDRQILLAGTTLGLATAAMVAFRHRDLGVERSLPRLPHRENRSRRPLRLGALLTGVYAKTLWERRVSLAWWTTGLAALAALTVSFWPTVAAGQEALSGLMESVPREVLVLFGFSDPQLLLTAAGFVSSRVYTGVGLILLLAFAISIGSASVAGEEAEGTLDLLLANPLPRSRLVVEKYLAMATLIAVVTLGVAVAVMIGGALVDLGVGIEGLAAASLGMALIALLFGGLALVAGAASGRPGVAVGVSGGTAAATYLLNGLGSLVDPLAPLRWLSPFSWYLGEATPLATGFSPRFLLLLGAVVVLPVVTVALFERRSLAA